MEEGAPPSPIDLCNYVHCIMPINALIDGYSLWYYNHLYSRVASRSYRIYRAVQVSKIIKEELQLPRLLWQMYVNHKVTQIYNDFKKYTPWVETFVARFEIAHSQEPHVSMLLAQHFTLLPHEVWWTRLILAYHAYFTVYLTFFEPC